MNRPVAVLLFSTALAMLSMAAPGAWQRAAPATEAAPAATEAAEQQPTEQANGQEPAEQEPEPFAADGIPPVPLPDEPVVYDTAQRQRIRVSVVTDGLTYPWGFAFLPDGSILVTERLGTLRRIRDGVLDPAPIAGVPEVSLQGQLEGLMDVAVHPDFAQNRLVYLTYSKPAGTARRWRWPAGASRARRCPRSATCSSPTPR